MNTLAAVSDKKKLYGWTLGLLLVSIWGCRQAGGPAGSDGGRGPEGAIAAAAPAVDALYDDWLAFSSGMRGASERFLGWETTPVWEAYAREMAQGWRAFASGTLRPMGNWAEKDLAEARERTKTLFYPFGGPDVVTALTLFPGARNTVLMGLEPVGNLADFERYSPERRDGFFRDMSVLMSDFFKRGYFVTEHMNEAFKEGRVDGALSVVAFFLKREGFSIAAVRRLAPDGTGGWKETPYEALHKRPRRPYGVRIDCFKPGDPAVKSVYYFSCDLGDEAFRKDGALYRLFDGLEDLTTFIKSASYLLHYRDFSNARGLILAKSLYVLEDDTGIPYRNFREAGWEIRLYGRYARPVQDFTGVEQPALRAAFETPGANVAKLPFRFGYHWLSRADNLLLMKRPPRPYKVPVLERDAPR